MIQPTFPVLFVGSGPGDPDLLTLRAARAITEADVVLYDRLVTPEILALATGDLVDVGKEGFGHHTPQEVINATIVAKAQTGLRVVRLKSGDATVFGRLDEELDAVTDAGLRYDIVPGITSASAAVASIGQSLTRRGRNASVRFVTGHDMRGFAEQDWRSLTAPGQVAAIYMGKRAARFIQGRLTLYGADPATPVTVIENASRRGARHLATTLDHLATDLAQADYTGPAIMLLGLAPRAAITAMTAMVPLPDAAHLPAPTHPHSFQEEVA
ncbi:MAG: uroporphyrinogen-III C-methyltransferase [Primorskyibacter sp.]